jgi:hypothetical protein
VKFDGDEPVLSFPGFHQVFFYGDGENDLLVKDREDKASATC